MKKSIKFFVANIVCTSLLLASATAAFADTVVVKRGDTLAKIAVRELGEKNRYKEICELNLRTLKHDCNYLKVGMVLTLPPRDGKVRKAVVSRSPSFGASSPNTIILVGDFIASFGLFGSHSLEVPEGYEATPDNSYVELSGYVADASAGGKPGIWLQLPESIEERFSGKQVVVKAVVRMRRTPGPIAFAYSTADVGNSGWVTKGAGTRFNVVSFTYQVPEMKMGRGDYIGILPDPRGMGQVLQLAELAIDVLDQQPEQ